MSDLGKELSALPAAEALKQRQAAAAPSGWEPGVAWDGTKGTLTTEPLTEAPKDWSELLSVWGLDPDLHEVIEPVGFRAWDGAVKNEDGTTGKQRMYYYRANVRLRRGTGSADIESMLEDVRNWTPDYAASTSGEQAFIVCLNDWQIGKSDGDGTDGTIKRILKAIEDVELRIFNLRLTGMELGTLYVMGLGDMVENCNDHYAMQTFTVELTMTEQLRVTRQLIVKALMRWAQLFDKVVVAAVQGNHGEVRKDGKAFTDFADNMDTDVFACAYEVLQANPDAFGHVSFVFPQGQETTLVLDCAGTRVGLAHGQQFTNVNKVTDWWAKQAHGRQAIGDADVLITAHFHHLRLMQDAKTWIQAPALDGGSDWWRHRSGNDAPPGVLTLVVGGGAWSDLAVL